MKAKESYDHVFTSYKNDLKELVKEKKILFKSPVGDLCSVNFDGTSELKLFDKKDYKYINSASLSPDGSKTTIIVYDQNIKTSFLYILDIVNNTIIEVKNEKGRRSPINHMVWSPDSKKLLYSCREKGALWITSTKEGNSTMIGEGKTYKIIDGKSRKILNFYRYLNFLNSNDVLCISSSYYVHSLYYHQTNWISHGDLVIMNSDGNNKKNIISNTRIQNLILLPFNKVVYQLNSCPCRAYILDIASGIQEKLPIEEEIWLLTSSLDGKKVSYVVSKDYKNFDIYIMSVSNHQTYRLVKTVSAVSNFLTALKFSSCGKKLVYSVNGGVYIVNIDGTNCKKIVEGQMFWQQ